MSAQVVQKSSGVYAHAFLEKGYPVYRHKSKVGQGDNLFGEPRQGYIGWIKTESGGKAAYQYREDAKTTHPHMWHHIHVPRSSRIPLMPYCCGE